MYVHGHVGNEPLSVESSDVEVDSENAPVMTEGDDEMLRLRCEYDDVFRWC
jgi:hypothetical protein